MKATLDIPDDLMRAIRLRAAREERTLKDLTADLLRRGLNSAGEPEHARAFPRIDCPPAPGALAPQDVDDLLLTGDVDALSR